MKQSNLTIKHRPKTECEICGEKDSKILQKHHIIERTELNTDNSDWNIAIICPTCHSKTHDKSIRIIGVFPSTNNIYGRMLVYVKDGVCNVPSLQNSRPYYQPKPQAMSLFIKEENEN